ncbi:glycine-rich cell wall structural protein precursor [Pseudonocardia sp. N23]|nr:glycine-rich cell wall structural protein precursor [Pseudonocardia sp. N23]
MDEILSQIPLSDLAAQLGTDEATAEQATRQALPALLGGIQANTDDPGGAASFAQAVDQHSSSLLDGGVDLGDVDTGDGQKIVSHVFGSNQDQVINQLGGLGGGSGGLMSKLLPLLAPIVMSYLAKKLGGAAAGGGGAGGALGGGGGGLGDLLGGILGGAGGGQGGNQGGALGGGLGDLLGGLLGGGTRR